MRLNIIIRYTGLVLLLNAAVMLLAAVVALLQGGEALFYLLLSAAITGVAGIVPVIFVRPAADITSREGTSILALSWLASCLFGMLPYLLWGEPFSLVNAWFESVSGYTTTGATILKEVEALPKGLLFWRSATHFIGGLGVVLMLVLVLPTMRNLKLRLAKTEISPLSQGNYKFRVQQTARVITFMYIGLILAETGALMIAGMDWFDAINHSFSTIATGGFSTRNESILSFHNGWIEVVITVFMIISGMHFGLLYTALRGEYKPLWKSAATRFYLIGMLLGSLLIAFNLLYNGLYNNIVDAFRYGAFQVVCITTTSGFATADAVFWPSFSVLLLIYFMFQCACAGSTTGGIKVDRVWILLKSIRSLIRKQRHPNAIIPTRIGGVPMDAEAVSSVALFAITYILMAIAGTLVLTALGIDLMTSFSASASCLGNVGPAFGDIGGLGNYDAIPFIGKFVLTLQMLFGRLEIFGLLLVFFVRSWR